MLERRLGKISFYVSIAMFGLMGCNGNSGSGKVIYNSSQDRPALTPTPQSTSNLAEDYERQVKRLERKKFEEVMSKYQVICESEKDCPESVGMLTMVGDSKTEADVAVGGRCTGFLLSDTLLMTNHHCVDIGKNISMTILFPKTARFAAENIRVSRIVGQVAGDASAVTNPLYQDAAILELERSTSRPSVSLSGATMAGGDRVQIYAVDPVEGGGVLRIKDCHVSENGFSDNERDSVRGYRQVVLRDCEIMSGNSGSPVVDTHGNAVAINFAATNVKELMGDKTTLPESWRTAIAQARFSYSNRMGCLPRTLFQSLRVNWSDRPVCESLAFYTKNDFFPSDETQKALTDRNASSTFVTAPEGPRFVSDRQETPILMLPGCATTLGESEIVAPLLYRSFALDSEARIQDVRFEAAGARSVRYKITHLGEFEGMKVAKTEISDGSTKLVTDVIPQCDEPLIPGLIPQPLL